MTRLNGFLSFILTNFGAVLFFYVVNGFADIKIAVFSAIGYIVCELIWFKANRIQPTFFFYVSALMIIVFGLFDILMKDPFLFRYEAALTNLVSAVFFAATLLKQKTIIEEFAEAQGRTTSSMISEDKIFFFRFYTIVWSIYFLVKAIIYFWLSFHASTEKAFLLRIAIGNASFWVMIFLSTGMAPFIWKLFQKYRLFPSQKLVNSI